ncbi:collectin-11 [Plakobranchus ocellatus]|uniref:Collectin-11 n=1 Tax=Plakobranchus ocellatus TaxID=259542 RepID=A0AAV3YS72_9GAST|nr:collectin-11 [Plakobranchus ocellatus]
MYLRTVLLLLGVLAIASAQGNPKPLMLRVNKPLEKDRDLNPLQAFCTFKNSMTKMSTVNSLTILRSETGKKADFIPIATITPKSKSSGLESELTASGHINQGGESAVIAQYKEPNNGYCFYYKCLIEGTDKQGRQRSYSRTIQDVCKTDKRKTCCADLTEKVNKITEEIENNAQASLDLGPKLLEAANKLASIDRVTYSVSSVYKGRVYIVTRVDAFFNIIAAGKECVNAGGYLVEIDDREEQKFVGAFGKQAGRVIFTGENDIETEGSFVHYQSKKPMPNLLWYGRNPSNSGNEPGEDCVIVFAIGLNDVSCKAKGKFVCEIPLI